MQNICVPLIPYYALHLKTPLSELNREYIIYIYIYLSIITFGLCTNQHYLFIHPRV